MKCPKACGKLTIFWGYFCGKPVENFEELWKIFSFKKPVEKTGKVFHRFSTGTIGFKSFKGKAFKKLSTVSTGPTTTI
jgi:hypothetical protein